jgi:dTDP-glucose 4,6-dehydratase
VDWYRDNPQWWRPIKSGEWRAYYTRQYGEIA